MEPASDQEIANRIVSIIQHKFSSWFSARWLAYEYQIEYGEITTQKVLSVLESLRDDGYLLTRKNYKSEKQKISFLRAENEEVTDEHLSETVVRS
ncbi:MAG: hypothetical protein QXU18_04660 [Thermoplasmatales archaeon]